MSEGLDRLKLIHRDLWLIYDKYPHPECNNNTTAFIEDIYHFKDIEKELKRLEDIDSILNTGGGIWAENGIVAKKLKAFELIKKKRVNVAYLIWCIETFDYKEGLALEQYNLSCAKDEWTLTQEEYEFLEGEKL